MKFHDRTDDGLLVVIEGIDGSGKSSLIKNIVHSIFNGQFGKVSQTKEPKGDLQKAIEDEFIQDNAELLQWFLDDRAKHQAEVVLPVLESGFIVIQDRSWHSTLACQGEQFSEEEIIAEMDKRPPLLPDVLILLDIDPKIAAERIFARDDIDPSDITDDNLARAERIRDRYRAMIAQPLDVAKYFVVQLDGERPTHDLSIEAMDWISTALDQKARLRGKQDAPDVDQDGPGPDLS